MNMHKVNKTPYHRLGVLSRHQFLHELFRVGVTMEMFVLGHLQLLSLELEPFPPLLQLLLRVGLYALVCIWTATVR
ncbi:hypothetical protein DPMN_034492 [Dreissena polymorpha]|uniref:Uncharacterized protein n=1 Tax=Dreissena polymorpha TaxID=45954 RepID=A0A9D4M5T8_DREPO|nr:hypothetical protein DPMN_034492 [Dreissena polymorpha]